MTIKKLITDKKLSTSYPQPVDNSYTENLKAVLDLIFGPNQDIGKAKSVFFAELDRANVQGEIYKLANTVFNAIDAYMGKHPEKDSNLSDKDKKLLEDLDNVGTKVELEPVKEDTAERIKTMLSRNIKEGKILGMLPIEDCLYILNHWSKFKALPRFLKFTDNGLESVGEDEKPDLATAYTIVNSVEDLPMQFIEDMELNKLDDLRKLFPNSNISIASNGELTNDVFAVDGGIIDVIIDWPSGIVTIDNTDELFSYIDFGGITTCLNNIACDSSKDRCPDRDYASGSFKFMGYRYADSDTVRYPVSISELCDFGSKKPLALVFKFTRDPRAKA